MPQELQIVGAVDAAAHALRADVLAGRIRAGRAVTEAAVATRYDIARPTAKAAIEKLVARGLLERSANRSARVRSWDEIAVRDVYATRRRLEGAALVELAQTGRNPAEAHAANADIAALAADGHDIVDADMRFHRALVDALGSERMTRMYAGLADEVRLCMAQVQSRGLVAPASIIDDHTHILARLEARDGVGAQQRLAQHLDGAAERLIDALQRTEMAQ